MGTARLIGARGGRRAALCLLALASLLTHASAAAAPGQIRTIVGGGVLDGPDGQPRVRSAGGVAVDAQGRLVFSDMQSHRVRRVTEGKAITIAGNGSEGFAGEGRSGAEVMFDHLHGIDVDAAGSILVADNENNRIRRISNLGVVTTVAGGSRPVVNTNLGDGGQATSASFLSPYDVAAAADGGFYFSVPNYIRRVDASGAISTVAGLGIGGYDPSTTDARLTRISTPYAIALAPDGSVLFADRSTHVVRRITPQGTVMTVAGTGTAGFSGDGGLATAARLNTPSGLEVTSDGSVLIGDALNHRVRKVSTDGTITTIAGTGVAGSSGDGGHAVAAGLYYPRHLQATSDGGLYLAEAGSIRLISADGTIRTVVQRVDPIYDYGFGGDGGPATEASLYRPTDVVQGPDGIYIADLFNYRIRKLSPDGTIATVAGTGARGDTGDGGPAISAALHTPHGLAIDNVRNLLYVTSMGAHRVRAIDLVVGTITTIVGTGAAGYGGDGGPASQAQLNRPHGLHVAPDGALYITELGGHRVRRIGADGIITTIAGTGTPGFSGDGGTAVAAQLWGPADVAVAPDGSIFIADAYNHAIRRVDPTGIITTVVGRGPEGQSCGGWDSVPASITRLDYPDSITFGPDGLLYISDTGNARVRRVDANGIIRTVAGQACSWSFRGDGGPATSAALHDPSGFSFDASGGLLIADTQNDRIRYVEGPLP